MKVKRTLIYVFLLLNLFKCDMDPDIGNHENNNRSEPCTCDILDNIPLLAGVKLESIETNSSREAIEEQQYASAKIELETQRKRIPEGKINVFFPVPNFGKKYFVKYSIDPGITPNNYQKFFLAYCSKFYDFIDKKSCLMNDKNRMKFGFVKDSFIQIYLFPESSSLPLKKTDDNHFARIKNSPSINKVNLIEKFNNDFYRDNENQKALQNYALVCRRYINLFHKAEPIRDPFVKQKLKNGLKLYNADKFQSALEDFEEAYKKISSI